MTLLVVTQNACGTSILVEGQHNLRVLGVFFWSRSLLALASVWKLGNTLWNSAGRNVLVKF